ncbi:MAG: hypothetical protein EOO78_38060, partial [Oxalobacteraceae bacterium]
MKLLRLRQHQDDEGDRKRDLPQHPRGALHAERRQVPPRQRQHAPHGHASGQAADAGEQEADER